MDISIFPLVQSELENSSLLTSHGPSLRAITVTLLRLRHWSHLRVRAGCPLVAMGSHDPMKFSSVVDTQEDQRILASGVICAVQEMSQSKALSEGRKT